MDELVEENPRLERFAKFGFFAMLDKVYAMTGAPFILVIDEWDCAMRAANVPASDQTVYLDWLRNLLKDRASIALAYMTGILPIKKCGEHSALNMFTEISMVNTKPYGEYTGFTEAEVAELCERYGADLEVMRSWYDGYCVDGLSIFNPKSVVESLLRDSYYSYWSSTETFYALKKYLDLPFDGMRDKVVQLFAGERVHISTGSFVNDMTTFASADDVLTLLVHLGYLTYDERTGMAWVPNREVRQEFESSVRTGGWDNVAAALSRSDELMRAVREGDERCVAELVAEAHMDETSVIRYHDENLLACALSIAFYAARQSYKAVRELPAGMGFADIALLPLPGNDVVPMVIEIKWDQSADSAIAQIHERRYPKALEGLSGACLLVGISYDKDAGDKAHRCVIERVDLDEVASITGGGTIVER